MTDLAADLGRILTAARETSGKSRRAMAGEHGMADTSLLAVEHGTANPTIKRIEELAELYGVEVAIVATSDPVAGLIGRPTARTQ